MKRVLKHLSYGMVRVAPLIGLIFLAGCTPPRRIGHATPNGEIYIDTEYINKHGLSLEHVEKHEQYHVKGLGHCPDWNCVMYYAHPWFGKRDLCSKCTAKLHPTTLDWLQKVLKQPTKTEKN